MTSPSPLPSVPFPSNSPCAACKFLRRKCQADCIFAPYFKPDQSEKFVCVHRIFGASNVGKILNDIRPQFRDDAVSALVYEAEMRIRDPVYGCVGVITRMSHELRRVQVELSLARAELAYYDGLVAAGEFGVQQGGFFETAAGYDVAETRLLENGGGECVGGGDCVGGGVANHQRSF